MARPPKKLTVDPATQIANMEKPWLQLDGETDMSYTRFVMYRDLGRTRSHGGVLEQGDWGIALIQHESSRWKWRDRVNAWDRYEQERIDELLIQKKAQRRDKHIAYLDSNAKVMMSLVQEAAKRIVNGSLDWAKLSDKELLKETRLMAPEICTIIQLERTINEEANEIHEVNHKGLPKIIKPMIEDVADYELPPIDESRKRKAADE